MWLAIEPERERERGCERESGSTSKFGWLVLVLVEVVDSRACWLEFECECEREM